MASILHKRKAADPSASDLAVGELAINTSDGGVFTKTSGGSVVEVGSASTGTPTDITVADESSDTTCFPLFATAATGDLGPKSGSNLTFNSSTGALAATLLNGGAGDDLSLDFGSVA